MARYTLKILQHLLQSRDFEKICIKVLKPQTKYFFIFKYLIKTTYRSTSTVFSINNTTT